MDSIKQSRQTLACNTADYASRFSRVSLLLLLFLSLAPRAISGAFGEHAVAAQQLYVTMHSAPVDDWCPPCIASEKLLKDSGVDFKKIREPLGPWPWFQFTDTSGNQRRLAGGLSPNDVAKIKKGEWPEQAR